MRVEVRRAAKAAGSGNGCVTRTCSPRIRITKVVLATAHHDHGTANNEDANLAALCQCCHTVGNSHTACVLV